jgi:pyruvate kinase
VHKVGDLADTTGLGEAAANKEKLGPWPEKKKKA